MPLWQVVILLQGLLLVFLFTLEHETIHRTAFATGWMNDLVAGICGFLLLIPPVWFRYFHFAHHRHTHDPDKDPELASQPPETWRAYLLHVSGIPLWKSLVQSLIGNALMLPDNDYIPPRARKRVRAEARLFVLLYGVVLTTFFYFNAVSLVWLWVVPVLVGQPFLRLYLMAEHGRCPHVANMFENTRTTFTSRLVRWLAWNMPYHAEHHACPTVPFHKLPDLHQRARAHLLRTSDGYSGFHREMVASFSVKTGVSE